MKVDINFDFGCKLVRGASGKYKHTFGGEFDYRGTVPEGAFVPVNLLFRLDLTDPSLPFRIESDFRFLPFFYAFSYDGSPMSYAVHSDDEIEILGVDAPEYVPDCPYPGFPQSFDLVPVNVHPITYEEQRDIAMAWFIYSHPAVYEAIPPSETERLRHYPVTRIGCVHDLLQYPRGEPCPNPNCKNHDERFWLHTLATIPEKPFGDFDLWQADGPTIQIVYEICPQCGSIRTYNTCD